MNTRLLSRVNTGKEETFDVLFTYVSSPRQSRRHIKTPYACRQSRKPTENDLISLQLQVTWRKEKTVKVKLQDIHIARRYPRWLLLCDVIDEQIADVTSLLKLSKSDFTCKSASAISMTQCVVQSTVQLKYTHLY